MRLVEFHDYISFDEFRFFRHFLRRFRGVDRVLVMLLYTGAKSTEFSLIHWWLSGLAFKAKNCVSIAGYLTALLVVLCRNL